MEMLARLNEILQQAPFDVTFPVVPETPLRTLPKWDSLKHLTLLVEIEKSFGKPLSTAQARSLETVSDILEHLKK